MQKFWLEVLFDFFIIAVFMTVVIISMFVSNKIKQHVHTDKCLIEENQK